MSNRQARIARKERQRAGDEVYVHVRPTQRVLAPVQIVTRVNGFTVVPHESHRELKRRRFRYEQATSGRKVGRERRRALRARRSTGRRRLMHTTPNQHDAEEALLGVQSDVVWAGSR